jgi:NADH:ubiquinone oxidoreductase subunit 4 (subunit M)
MCSLSIEKVESWGTKNNKFFFLLSGGMIYGTILSCDLSVFYLFWTKQVVIYQIGL